MLKKANKIVGDLRRFNEHADLAVHGEVGWISGKPI
jgi:hypothetical protein